MDKKKGLRIITIIVAFVFAVIVVSMTYATYTSTLSISGRATSVKAKWSIIFTDLEKFSNQQTAYIGNEAGFPITARELSAPSIVGDTSIENFEVQLKTPGDYVSYVFNITNNGDFRAKVDYGFSMPVPICKKSINGVLEDKTNVCNNLSYTLNYINNGIIGNSVSSADTFDAGESKKVILKIKYNPSDNQNLLPKDDVKISNLDFIIPFVQY